MQLNFSEFFSRRKILISVLVVVFLLFGIIYLGTDDYFLRQQLKNNKIDLRSQQVNDKIVSFLQLFIEKVLENNEEVSFEDRLRLENAVRDLADEEILQLWQNFTGAENSDDVQIYCKELLDTLARKIISEK